MDNVRYLEGVFAIDKPPHLSSAQVLRDIQERFNPSQTFSPWLAAERARLESETAASGQRHQPRKKRWERKHSRVKIGHGGTLDPLARGVLIAGIGGGTKKLSGFLGCTKTYETVVLFGTATDSYDSAGKVVKRSSASTIESITKDKVEIALEKFRGDIMQRPPIYSALHIQGKRLYEYARQGIAVPVEIPERPVKVESLELVEWLEPGSHEFRPPSEEVGEEDRAVAENLLIAAETGVVPASDKLGGAAASNANDASKENGEKRKRSASADADVEDGKKRSKTEAGVDAATLVGADGAATELGNSTAAEDAGPVAAIAAAVGSTAAAAVSSVTASTAVTSADSAANTSTTTTALPAVRLRMTVGSGFYVRSLAHDLGVAVGGLAFMADLVRTRQERFELGKDNVLEYSDIMEHDETVWGPKVVKALKEWNDSQDQSSST